MVQRVAHDLCRVFLLNLLRNIGLHGFQDYKAVSSLVLSQLCGSADLSVTAPGQQLKRLRTAEGFLAQFQSRWGPNRDTWGGSVDDEWMMSPQDIPRGPVPATRCPRQQDIMFQYHMRMFTTGLGWWRTSLGLERVAGSLEIPATTKRHLDIREIRYSIALKTTWEMDLPVFSLVTMTDCFSDWKQLGRLSDVNTWEEAGICPAIRATGVAAFALRIRSLLPGWAAHWTRLLDHIDKFHLRTDVSVLLFCDVSFMVSLFSNGSFVFLSIAVNEKKD